MGGCGALGSQISQNMGEVRSLSQVEAQLNALRAEIESLGAIAGQLNGRLVLVTRAEAEIGTKNASTPPAALVPIADAIRAHAQDVRIYRERLSQLLERIEL